MKYKEPHFEDQLKKSPQKLQEVVWEFDRISTALGIEPICTRVWDHVEGESGVHPARRAADFRDQTFDENNQPHYLYSPTQVQDIIAHMNTCFPRDDGKPLCLHHSFQGMPEHFHLQIPITWLTKEELKSIYGLG